MLDSALGPFSQVHKFAVYEYLSICIRYMHIHKSKQFFNKQSSGYGHLKIFIVGLRNNLNVLLSQQKLFSSMR
jgi:hypothetical protein